MGVNLTTWDVKTQSQLSHHLIWWYLLNKSLLLQFILFWDTSINRVTDNSANILYKGYVCVVGIGSESPRTTMYNLYYNGIKRMVRDGRAGIPNLSHVVLALCFSIEGIKCCHNLFHQIPLVTIRNQTIFSSTYLGCTVFAKLKCPHLRIWVTSFE